MKVKPQAPLPFQRARLEPAHQVCLDLSPQAASAWTLEPPGFRLLALPPDQRLVSHLVPCGSFDGPHPFHDAAGLID